MLYQKFKSVIDALIKDLEVVISNNKKVDYSWNIKGDKKSYDYQAINVMDFDFDDGFFIEKKDGQLNINAASIENITRTDEIDAISYTVDCGMICYRFDVAAQWLFDHFLGYRHG